MLQHDYLFSAGGLLSMGGQAERVFGRKNFMELYAVFSSPVLYKVQTKAGYIIGSLEQAFVDKLVPGMSSFLLGGRVPGLLTILTWKNAPFVWFLHRVVRNPVGADLHLSYWALKSVNALDLLREWEMRQ